MSENTDPARLGLDLAACGWHVFPLSARKRPLASCPACQPRPGARAHPASACPCLPAGAWCHGVRAATTDPARITTWWRRAPRAVPGVAAGPSGLLLIDIDAHHDQLPPRLATGLLPGIDLTAEPVSAADWADPARYHDGRDTLSLLARLRGSPHPWPADPLYQPVTTATPAGGVHLWYRAPADALRQALSDPRGRYGLAWQVDIKAGWSYGVAPGATGYPIRHGDLAAPGYMPAWLGCEIIRVASPVPPPAPARPSLGPPGGSGPTAYLTTVIARGTAQLATMTDGRQRALSALAYHAGGLLGWSGLTADQVSTQLTQAGIASGLSPGMAARIVHRAITNGISRPVSPPRHLS